MVSTERDIRCSFCGTTALEHHRFCTECGAILYGKGDPVGDREQSMDGDGIPARVLILNFEPVFGLDQALVFTDQVESPVFTARPRVDTKGLSIDFFVHQNNSVNSGTEGSVGHDSAPSWVLETLSPAEQNRRFQVIGLDRKPVGTLEYGYRTGRTSHATARDREGREFCMEQYWSFSQSIVNRSTGLFRSLGSSGPRWQGWVSGARLLNGNLRSRIHRSGSLLRPFFSLSGFGTMGSRIDRRLLLGMLALQGFGLLQPLRPGALSTESAQPQHSEARILGA